MALINNRAHEIHFKIVYVGPGLGGKTTNLQLLHDRLPPERRGELISIATENERTLLFDFLPIDLGQVHGYLTRFHLYTVPGQVYYRLSRRAVLQGVDGIVFVADSHPAREQANVDALNDALGHLDSIGVVHDQRARLPWVFQYNKRDLPYAVAVDRLRAALNPAGAPDFESVAREGRGVSETLRAACKAVLAKLTGEIAEARPTTMPDARAFHAAPSMTPATVSAPALAVTPRTSPVASGSPGVPRTSPAAHRLSANPSPAPVSGPARLATPASPRPMPPITPSPATAPRPVPAAPRSAESTPARPFQARPRIQTAPRRPWRGPGGSSRV